MTVYVEVLLAKWAYNLSLLQVYSDKHRCYISCESYLFCRQLVVINLIFWRKFIVSLVKRVNFGS